MSHPIIVEVVGAEPPEVAVGTKFILKCRVACAQGCDLVGASVELIGPDDGSAEFAIGPEGFFDAALQAPPRAGDHVWRVVFNAHKAHGVQHEEAAALARISVKPQATSLAVWDIPSPVVTGERFAIRVGAKSSAAVPLGGTVIEICDEAGALLGEARLTEAPLPGTSALYWTEVKLTAPTAPGMQAWSARFAPAGLALDHQGTAYRFDVVVVPPPEHRLTVKVVEHESAAPIADAQVRLGAYRATTDASGRCEIATPKGSYTLTVWKAGYEAPPTSVEVSADLTVEVAVLALPEENPDAAWTM
jgi:hypothetical protein